MTQNITNISDIESHAEMNVVAGKLPADTRRELGRAYFQLYFGLSWTNWIRPNTSLGRAWQTALNQINAFVSTKDAKNPAVAYLGRVNAAHQHAWPKNIMTNPQRDGTLTQNPERVKQWREYGARQVESAMTTIAIIIARYNVRDMAATEQTKMSQETSAQTNATASATQSAAMPMTQPAVQPTAQPVAQPVAQTTAEPTAQPAAMTQPVTQPTAQPVAQPVAAARPVEKPIVARPRTHAEKPIVSRPASPVAAAMHNMPQTVVAKSAGAKQMPNDMMRTIPTNSTKRALGTNPTKTRTLKLRGPRAERPARPIVAKPKNRAQSFKAATARIVQMTAARERPHKLTPAQIAWLRQYSHQRAA